MQTNMTDEQPYTDTKRFEEMLFCPYRLYSDETLTDKDYIEFYQKPQPEGGFTDAPARKKRNSPQPYFGKEREAQSDGRSGRGGLRRKFRFGNALRQYDDGKRPPP